MRAGPHLHVAAGQLLHHAGGHRVLTGQHLREEIGTVIQGVRRWLFNWATGSWMDSAYEKASLVKACESATEHTAWLLLPMLLFAALVTRTIQPW